MCVHRGVCVCVFCTLGEGCEGCEGRGLKIPKQALLEMIMLIKAQLCKLPPPPPPMCSLNTLNQEQVCPDAFTDSLLAICDAKTASGYADYSLSSALVR